MKARRVLMAILAVEVLAVLAAVGWRLSRPTPPAVNLDRLPPTTAAQIERVRSAVWSDTVAAWQELGEAYLAFGYFAEAEHCLNLAAQRAPGSYPILFNHACSLERLGRLSEANQQFAAASGLVSSSSTAAETCQFRIARNALRSEDATAAEAAFAKIAKLPAGRCAQARYLIRRGRAEEALPILDEMRDERELDVHTEMATVQAYRELQRPREAFHAAERANRAQARFVMTDYLSQLQPIRQRYALNGAMTQIDELTYAGNIPAAADVFDRFFVTAPADFLEQLMPKGVQLDLEARRPEGVLHKLDWIANRMSVPLTLRHMSGVAYAELGQFDKAIEHWKAANLLQPSANTHNSLAELYGNRQEAALADEEQLAGQLQMGIDQYRANNLEAAHRELKAVCNRTPDNPRAWYALGITLFALDRQEEARGAVERCLELAPHHGRARQLQTVLE